MQYLTMFLKHADYVSVPTFGKEDDMTEEPLLHHSESEYHKGRPGISGVRNLWNCYWAYLTHGILLLLGLAFFALWIRAQIKVSILLPLYSPANVAIENDYKLKYFNGSFRNPSIYRGHPTPELDAAWLNVSTGVKLTRLTKDQLLKIGKEDTASKVKYREEDGEGYMAALEVTHQLHCLNMFRKYLYFDHYGKFDPFFTESKPETYRTHLEHCIDNLRQVLMCSADSTMITFEWVRGFSTAYPDFSTRHKCRNFDKLIAWQNTNGIHGISESQIVRYEGEVDLVNPP